MLFRGQRSILTNRPLNHLVTTTKDGLQERLGRLCLYRAI
jgi:hypothetical protein